MEIDNATLLQLIKVVDEAIRASKDECIWKSLAAHYLKEQAAEAFEMAQSNPEFARAAQIQVAELVQARNALAAIAEQALRGDSIHIPPEQVH